MKDVGPKIIFQKTAKAVFRAAVFQNLSLRNWINIEDGIRGSINASLELYITLGRH